jgi:hypothetical protein
MPNHLKRFSAIAGTICALSAAPLLAGLDPVFVDGFNGGDSCFWDLGPSSCLGTGFEIESPEASIGPGEESTYCYYFRTPNEAAVGIKRWQLTMGSVVHDAALFATFDLSGNPVERQAPETFTTVNCGFEDSGATSTVAKWVFGAHDSGDQLVMPIDDGAGSPLAMEVLADQPMFLRIHFINTTGVTIPNTVTLEAEGLPDETTYTRTASYMTYNTNISVGVGQTGSATETCGVPPAVKFWWLSTETHKFATQTRLQDGASILLTNNDWEDPAIATYSAPAFLDITAVGGLTYQCDYNNFSGSTLVTGDSPDKENCIAIGYFFPATQSYLCYNSTSPF